VRRVPFIVHVGVSLSRYLERRGVPTWDKRDFGTSMQPRCAPSWINRPRARADGKFREALHLSRGLQVSCRRKLSRAHVGQHVFRCANFRTHARACGSPPSPAEHNHGAKDAAHARSVRDSNKNRPAAVCFHAPSQSEPSRAHARGGVSGQTTEQTTLPPYRAYAPSFDPSSGERV